MAHARQIAAMLAALTSLETELVCLLPLAGLRRAGESLGEHLFKEYGVSVHASARPVPVLPFSDEIHRGWRLLYSYAVLRLNSLIYSIGVLFSNELHKADYIYTRHLLLAFFLCFVPSARKKLVIELHDLPSARWERLKTRVLLGSRARIGVISVGLLARLKRLSLAEIKATLVLVPDAVSNAFAAAALPREEARKRLGVQADALVVTYCGSLHSGKDPDVLVRAMADLERLGCICWIIGGHQDQIAQLRDRHSYAQNVKFWGMQPQRDVPTFLSASDVLLVTYSSHSRFAEFSSPLKVFEYAAVGRPIVAPDVPSIREILTDGETAVLYRPGDAEDLATCISSLLGEPQRAARLAAGAAARWSRWTWEGRAVKLFGFNG